MAYYYVALIFGTLSRYIICMIYGRTKGADSHEIYGFVIVVQVL